MGGSFLFVAMKSITMGLRVGLDYHKIADMLNVETTKNVDYFELCPVNSDEPW